MYEQIVIAGFGGQGVLFVGKTLAYLGMDTGKNISWLPSYGPEMRGGTCNCSVIISDNQIGSPIIQSPDTLIAMNKPSLEKFVDTVKPGGIIVLDRSLIDLKVERSDVKVVYIPAMEIAESFGNSQLGNMVMTGAYIKARETMFSADDLYDSVKTHIPPQKMNLAEKNIEMIKAGYEYDKC